MRCAPPTLRRGFTLVELIVAMGLLVGLMTMVGAIFKIATDSASQGTATLNVYRNLRAVRQVILEDLKNFDPANGALAIYGWEQLAHASGRDRDSGRDLDGLVRQKPGQAMNSYRPPRDYHRADILMLTTNVESSPFAYRDNNNSAVSGEGQIIVYGHADVGELSPAKKVVPDDDEWVTASNNEPLIARIRRGEDGIGALGIIVGDEVSDIPASQWHLARRAVVTSSRDTSLFSPKLNPDPLEPTGNLFQLSQSDMLKVQRLGQQAGGEGAPFGDFVDRFDMNAALDSWSSNALSPGGIPNDWYYNSAVLEDNRSVIVPSPPAGQQRRLASHFLPGCMDFQIEVTFDTPDMVYDDVNTGLVDPQPPTNWFTIPSGRRIEWVRGKLVGALDNDRVWQGSSDTLWKDVVDFAYGTYSQNNYKLTNALLAPVLNNNNPAAYPFPTAIRITIRVMDENESLYQPSFDSDTGEQTAELGIKEVIVHKF